MHEAADDTRPCGLRRGVKALTWLAALLVATLAGCGGGGGGGGGGNEADPATSVSVTLVEPTQPYVATVLVGRPAPSLRLVGRASGNLAALNGKTLVIVVEDPAGLFDRTPFVTVDASTGQTTIDLAGALQSTPGRLTGQLRVLVCLDAACKSQLKGSPLTLAYDVTVVPGLSVSPDTLDVTSTFGDPAFTRVVTATYQPGILLRLDVFNFVPGPISFFFNVTLGEQGTGTMPVTLSFERMPPGTYSGTMTFNASIDSLTIPVRHTVVDNPALAAAVAPASFSFTQAVGDATQHPTHFDILTRNGESLSFLGVMYLESPPASAGHAQHNQWLFNSVVSNENTVIPCDTFRADCLPAGTYRAASRWRVTRADGSTAALDVPYTLTLTP